MTQGLGLDSHENLKSEQLHSYLLRSIGGNEVGLIQPSLTISTKGTPYLASDYLRAFYSYVEYITQKL